MEVDRFIFHGRLLDVLTDISQSRFVALDLELSGVAAKKAVRGKKTLEEFYREVRDAASQYTILQFGLTCVIEDRENGKYVVKPYNFNLNPIIEERIGLDRTFSYQGSAVEFLLCHGFRMELPFTRGVPYLSREEATLATKQALERLDRNNIEDIVLKEDEVEALEFMDEVRDAITKWRGQKSVSPYFSNL